MLHKYRTREPIEAEQFDGSDEMIRKYDIRDHRMDGLTWFDLFTVKGTMEIDKGDWIIGNDGKYWTIPDDIFHRTYERCD